MKTEFLKQVSALVGQCCWAVVAGPGNGSMVSLHIGGKIARKSPLREKLVPQVRDYQGEYRLFVKECAWRVQDGDEIIGGWAEPEEAIQQLMGKFVGCTITGVECSNSALDLGVQFANRYILQLFCDRTLVEDQPDNYSFRTPHAWFTVGCRSRLESTATNVAAS